MDFTNEELINLLTERLVKAEELLRIANVTIEELTKGQDDTSTLEKIDYYFEQVE